MKNFAKSSAIATFIILSIGVSVAHAKPTKMDCIYDAASERWICAKA